MSINQFTEDSYEQTLIDLFRRMGYQYVLEKYYLFPELYKEEEDKQE